MKHNLEFQVQRAALSKTLDSTSRQSEWPLSKKLQTIYVGEGVEKKEPFCTVSGNDTD